MALPEKVPNQKGKTAIQALSALNHHAALRTNVRHAQGAEFAKLW
jgi:hypothetical protein